RHLAIEVVVLAVKERMFLHVHDDVKVARRAAGGAVFALAIQTQPLTSGDPCGNLGCDLPFAADAAGAAARLTGTRDRFPCAAAIRAGARDREKTLLKPELAGAFALGAHFGHAPRRRAGARTDVAGFLARNLDRRVAAGERFLERDLEVVSQVGPALRSAAAPPAAEHIAKSEQIAQIAEDIFEAGERVGIEPACARAADTGVSESIVCGALVLVAKDGVRLRRFLEPVGG